MLRLGALTALLVTCGTVVGAAAEPPAEPLLLEPYLFHGDEFLQGVESGETWLALVRAQNAAELVETTLAVEDAHDPIVDEEGEQTGKMVRVDIDGEVLALFRGVVELSPGSVQSVAYSPAYDTFVYPGQDFILQGGPGVSALRYVAYGNVVGTQDSNGLWMRVEDFTVVVYPALTEHGTAITEIARVDKGAFDGPRLLFAGDLNRDGHLDLLMDLTNHYNVSHKALFLSRIGSDGAVRWEKVAELRTTGC